MRLDVLAPGHDDGCVNEVTFPRTWAPDRRLHPWALYELEHTAWVVEMRASELTEDERRSVRDAARRMLDALSELPFEPRPDDGE